MIIKCKQEYDTSFSELSILILLQVPYKYFPYFLYVDEGIGDLYLF